VPAEIQKQIERHGSIEVTVPDSRNPPKEVNRAPNPPPIGEDYPLLYSIVGRDGLGAEVVRALDEISRLRYEADTHAITADLAKRLLEDLATIRGLADGMRYDIKRRGS
jgi:hypothetical protein